MEKYRLAKKWEQFKIVLLFMDHPVGMYLFCCVRIGLDWIQFMGHQLDLTGLRSVARGFGLDWIISTQSISYSGLDEPFGMNAALF